MKEWMARDGTMGHDTEKGRMGSDRKKKEVEKVKGESEREDGVKE